MVDIALDLNPAHIGTTPYRDLLVTRGDLLLTSDAYAPNAQPLATNPVLQNILQRMRFFAGEWFLDNTQGLPYYQQILIKNPNQANIDALYLSVLMNTPGVSTVTQYSFSVNAALRVLSVSFSCVTTTGTVSYTGNIPVTGGQG